MRNGAGKSTTMRLILDLDAPDAGSATVNGRSYRSCQRPLFEVGALLEVRSFHGGRSACNHLLCLASSNGIGRKRVADVLDSVGQQVACDFDVGNPGQWMIHCHNLHHARMLPWWPCSATMLDFRFSHPGAAALGRVPAPGCRRAVPAADGGPDFLCPVSHRRLRGALRARETSKPSPAAASTTISDARR
jgi:Multicopper oxidase